MSDKRILWLYNHSTLIKSEVPMLMEMGYEVYVPKIPPFDVSIAVDWSLDNQLTIPKEEIDILNRVNFYDEKIPLDAMEVMNKYFEYAINGVFIEPLKSLVMNYQGILIFHPFGLENGVSYTNIIEQKAGIWLLKEIEKLGNRFWFGQSYENLMEIECGFFRKRTIFLPIGMLDNSVKDKWTGSTKKVLFICPRIKINGYYEKLYKVFKEDFYDIPHSIGGAQPIMIDNDKSVLGYLDQKEYENLYPSHSVMFYHSQETRHVHYHPFEAIKCGLPLIYMAGGLLDKLGGDNLPGRCRSIAEAKRKCKRIINGDIAFADKIRNSQVVLLDKMSYNYCKQEWQKAFKLIEDSQAINNSYTYTRKRKLAVILPAEYTGGVLDYTIRLISAIKKGAEKHNDNLDIVFGYLDHPNYEEDDYFKKIRELHIPIRKFTWETFLIGRVKESLKILGYSLPYYNSKYCVPNDGINYFEDCDFLLFTADRIPEKLYIDKPYGVVIHDFIQRYIPELFGDIYEGSNIDLVRGAEAIFTTTETTKADCVQYVGVPSDNIHMFPLFFDTIKSDFKNVYTDNKFKDYFIWSTNTSKHKNHKVALKALSSYYAGGGKLKCYVTGVNTDFFDLKNKGDYSSYIEEVRGMIQRDKLLKANLTFCGNLPKIKYIFLLQNAKFLLHPGYADNGNGTAFDAAMLGVPTVSSDYPAMRNMNNIINLGISFFDRKSPDDLAALLFEIQSNSEKFKKRVPANEELSKFTIQNEDLCNEIYKTIKKHAYL